ncbi:hypothetical protein F7725_009595 [Dissostichus mawsoni]|uniref:Uncharacterized protein n=1 Tax=Dissostichus mawsoni TaxID=36200 RepID=A0A7J5XMK0_DISMA|nr:hypothetical protein F7725_009595 [Dissostichus mawsoni]
MYINKVFASFSQLTEKCSIPPSHLFRYFQIRNFTRSKYPQFPNRPAETTLDRIVEINVQNRGVIRVLYNVLSSVHSPSLSTIRSQWEDDLAFEIQIQIGNPPFKEFTLLLLQFNATYTYEVEAGGVSHSCPVGDRTYEVSTHGENKVYFGWLHLYIL